MCAFFLIFQFEHPIIFRPPNAVQISKSAQITGPSLNGTILLVFSGSPTAVICDVFVNSFDSISVDTMVGIKVIELDPYSVSSVN